MSNYTTSFGGIPQQLHQQLANPFYDPFDDPFGSNHGVAEVSIFEKNLSSDLEAEAYQCFVDRVREEARNRNVFKEILKVLTELKEPTEAIDQIYPLLRDLFLNMGQYEQFQLVKYYIMEDQPERVDFFLKDMKIPKENYQYYLHFAVGIQALECVDYFFSLKQQWNMTGELYIGWVIQNLGVPKVDACAKKIALHFLPKEVKDKLRPRDAIPYPMEAPMDLFRQTRPVAEHKGYSDACLEFFLCTPLMHHWLEHDLLDKKDVNKIPSLLANRFHNLVIGEGWLEPAREKLRLVLSMMNMEVNSVYYFSQQELFAPESTYEDVAQCTEQLILRYPTMIKREKVRSLVASQALVDVPHGAMVKRAKELTGRRLILRDLTLPWMEVMPDQEGSLVEFSLFDHWEERMPPKLVPAFKHSDFLLGLNVECWLERCEVVGECKDCELSTLGQALLQLSCDNAVFLESLTVGGILYEQKDKYWEWMNVRKNELRGHYLVSITHLKEVKNYEL